MDPNQNQSNNSGQRWAPGQNPFTSEPLSNPQPQQQQPSPQQPVQPQYVQPATQQPEVYNSPNLAAIPYGDQPSPQPVQNGVVAPAAPVKPYTRPSKGPNKVLIALIAVVVVSILIVLIAVLMAGSGSKKPQEQQQASQNSTVPQSLQPAGEIDVQQASNAIDQDVSSVDDEQDYPVKSLADDTLRL